MINASFVAETVCKNTVIAVQLNLLLLELKVKSIYIYIYTRVMNYFLTDQYNKFFSS